MTEARVVVVNKRGMHARPAAKLAKLASRYRSDIECCQGDRKVNMKSVAALLTLASPEGTPLTLRAKGEDEREALVALVALFAAGFEDDSMESNLPHPPVPDITDTDEGDPYEMQIFTGIGITRDCVVGKAHIHSTGLTNVPRYRLPESKLDGEVSRFRQAVTLVRRRFENLRKQEGVFSPVKPFIDWYLTMLTDEEVVRKPLQLIRKRRINAEWALKEQVAQVGEHFRNLSDSYLRERGRDIENLMERLLAAMKKGNQRDIVTTGEKAILVAHELDPMDVIHLHRLGYQGFVIETGSATSHTAILAHSMDLPALVGAPGVLAAVRQNDTVILDAENACAITNPDKPTLARHRSHRKRRKAVRQKSKSAGGKGILTADGETVYLQANIELPTEIKEAKRATADGIGLFRSEFSYLNRETLPTEDELFELYRQVASSFSPLPVVIRTLDIGADRMPGTESLERAVVNPLGVRAIRYCLAKPDIFLTQLRALLRATAECPNLRILLPLLSHPAELERTCSLIAGAREQLRISHQIGEFPLHLGGMIETPAAVFIIRALAKRLNFFSIGTNDLIQYTMAIDRDEQDLAKLNSPLHPAIIHLLARTVKDARQTTGAPTVCGEMAGDPSMTRLLLALGVRQLSMIPANLDAVREKVLRTDTRDARKKIPGLLRASTPETIVARLKAMNE